MPDVKTYGRWNNGRQTYLTNNGLSPKKLINQLATYILTVYQTKENTKLALD